MPKMIRVRSNITGQVTLLNELAYGAFAAHYERLDDDAPAAAEAGQPPAGPEPDAPKKTTRRGTAQSEKE